MRDTNGIYIIKNVKNDKCYIGSSRDVNNRMTSHKCLLLKNQHHSYKLQGSVNKHGINNFDFRIIERVYFPEEYDKSIRSEYLECLEQYYINKYDSYKKGYNVSEIPRIVANGNTKQAIAKAIATKRKNGSYNVSELTKKRMSESLKNSVLLKEKLKQNGLKRRKPIHQYDLNGNFIKTWDFIDHAAENLNVHKSSIMKNVCGKKKACKKFIFSNEKHDKILPYTKQKFHRRVKSVKMYDRENNLLKIYSNSEDCATDLKLKKSTISSYVTKPPLSINYRLEYGELCKQ